MLSFATPLEASWQALSAAVGRRSPPSVTTFTANSFAPEITHIMCDDHSPHRPVSARRPTSDGDCCATRRSAHTFCEETGRELNHQLDHQHGTHCPGLLSTPFRRPLCGAADSWCAGGMVRHRATRAATVRPNILACRRRNLPPGFLGQTWRGKVVFIYPDGALPASSAGQSPLQAKVLMDHLCGDCRSP